MSQHSIAALFFDLGDTLMDEGSEVKDASGTTLRAELVPGMAEALRVFKAQGLRLALVADSRPLTPSNVLAQHGLLDLFEYQAISEVVGSQKPDEGIFRAALDALGIPAEEYGRVVMVGNNLERDIPGANRLGMIAVFLHWNERRRTQPTSSAEIPAYEVTSASELVDLVAFLDGPGAQPPFAPDDGLLGLAARYAPRILFDENEPFLPLAAGVTLLDEAGPSPSFNRRIERAYLPPWTRVFEYAIWWDWDIGHLYELEHVWSYVGADGELVWCEGSWHGDYATLQLDDGTLPHAGSHPLVLSQPGKHAFAAQAGMYDFIRAVAFEDAGPKAGEDGVLVKEAYAGKINLQPGDQERVRDYLRQRAFTPAMRFNRPFEISRGMLVPWTALDAWIPVRVNWWLEKLRRANRMSS